MSTTVTDAYAQTVEPFYVTAIRRPLKAWGMFIINYVLLKGKRQWLRKWLPCLLVLPLGYYGHAKHFSAALSPTAIQRRWQHQRQEEEAAAQPRYHSLAQEQATAQQKAQLTPVQRKKTGSWNLSRNQSMGANWPTRTIGHMGSRSMHRLWHLRCRRSMYWSVPCQCLRMAWNARPSCIWQKGFHDKRKKLYILYGMWKCLSASGSKNIFKGLGRIQQLILPVHNLYYWHWQENFLLLPQAARLMRYTSVT